jgi:hypothetical protein
MNALVQKIGKAHSRFFGFLSMKAKTSKFWAILLSVAVLYEIVEHVVYPILIPYMAYLSWFAD